MPTVSERIKKFNKGRLDEFLAMKYSMMADNSFRFFRGTCHLFYEDLAKKDQKIASPLVWACGDLHLENFGSYKGENGLAYFDINDFDEAALAPGGRDLARFA